LLAGFLTALLAVPNQKMGCSAKPFLTPQLKVKKWRFS
jgi:hypothetical protein